MVEKPVFPLKLQLTYYRNGFFNVTVDYDRYVRTQEGPIRIKLGSDGQEIEGSISRHANINGTARIFGGARLRDWFQANFEPMDSVKVLFNSDDLIILEQRIDNPIVPKKPEAVGTGYSAGPGRLQILNATADDKAKNKLKKSLLIRWWSGFLSLLSLPAKFLLRLRRAFKK
jgi:hypothetical protein